MAAGPGPSSRVKASLFEDCRPAAENKRRSAVHCNVWCGKHPLHAGDEKKDPVFAAAVAQVGEIS